MGEMGRVREKTPNLGSPRLLEDAHRERACASKGGIALVVALLVALLVALVRRGD